MLKPRLRTWPGIALLFLGVIMLLAIYIFQQINFAALAGLSSLHPNIVFIINRTVRMLLNDVACFMLIYVLFQEKRYLKVAFGVFLTELFILLPAYLIVKLHFESDSEISSPLLSQIHRLIVNPMLMILLMAGFAYQRFFHE